MSNRIAWGIGAAAAAAVVMIGRLTPEAMAGGNSGTNCTASVGPDVIVGDLHQVANYTAEGNIEAFAVGTVSCNIGDQELQWISSTTEHPVIGQNMFRLNNGRLEQIGQAWLKHGFTALQEDSCGCGCISSGTGARLGVGCSDPYSAGLNGSQGGLGPKFEVNPFTGVFQYPFTDPPFSGSIARRIQVDVTDLDPAAQGGGMYFVEGHYVTPDDAAFMNQDNNASYRQVSVSGAGTAWSISLSGMPPTQRELPAIRAWADNEAGVVETDVRVPGDGLVLLAASCTDLGGGQYRYEYAVQNLNCDRAVGSFTVPISDAATVTNVGFHDVDYHSGEPFDGTDWPGIFDAVGGTVSWSTIDHATDPDANALRWGTLYNFRFDANVPPVTADVTLGVFKPGTPTSVNATSVTPATGPLDCNNNGTPDDQDIANGTSQDCNANGIPDECEPDCDGDGTPDACEGQADCNTNGIPDDCDITSGTSQDCNTNGVPDECEGGGGGQSRLYDIAVTPPLDIPDGTASFVSDTFTVPDSGTIQDINVGVTFTHTYTGDVTVRLSHAGTTVVLIDRPGFTGTGFGCAEDNMNAVLDDEGAGGAIEDQCTANLSSPPEYTPNTPLSAFDGLDKAGDWVIEISDSAGQDTGTLDGWSLDITNAGGGPDPCGPITDCNDNGIDDALDIGSGTSLDCNANGIPDECDIAAGTSTDCDFNGIPDECEVGPGDVKGYQVTVTPPLAIPDGTSVFVSDTFTVPDQGTIQDVDVSVLLSHTWNGDVTVRLTHNGMTAVLIDRPGFTGSGFGFDNDGFDVTLDDEGAGGPIESIDSGGGLVASPPSYVPNEALSIFDGMDKAGDWIIEASDAVTQDSGTLDGWTLTITNQGSKVDPCDPIIDCNNNGTADSEDIASGFSLDCNTNGTPDECDIGKGTSQDCNMNGIPDECEIDCNTNGTPDDCDIASGFSIDCDGGPVGSSAGGAAIFGGLCMNCHGPDGSGGAAPDIRDYSRVQILAILGPVIGTHPGGQHPEYVPQDYADLEAFLTTTGTSRGRPDGIPDECQTLADCDNDGTTDGCELENGTQVDTEYNGVPDSCECLEDCSDGNGIVDVTDLLDVLGGWGTSGPCDTNLDGIIDTADLLDVLAEWGDC